MKVLFRWFGSRDDSISLARIRQIPGVAGVAGTLSDIPAGEPWPRERIAALKNEVEDAGLELEVIESVNIHDTIKTGGPGRDQYIENYRTTIRNLAAYGVKVVCYNFMPVFDWIRSDLAKPLADGSTVFSYEQEKIDRLDPQGIAENLNAASGGYSLPGWEPERLREITALLACYREVTEDVLAANLKYFLEGVIPTCEEYGVKMAIHPDDPPWSVFGLPRIVRRASDLERILAMVDSPCNGLTLCSGSLGADPHNDIPAMIRRFGSRIHFAHVRNIQIHSPRSFTEAAHLSREGSLDLYEIMGAYHEIGFTGYLRPDHGRMIWGERARPGYGLYDRALGIAYINGLWEALEKSSKSGSAYTGPGPKP